jgi:hypothetical protein
VNSRTVLNVGAVSIVVDGRDRGHEIWDVDGLIMMGCLKKGCFLNFVGSNDGTINGRKGILVTGIGRRRVIQPRIHGGNSMVKDKEREKMQEKTRDTQAEGENKIVTRRKTKASHTLVKELRGGGQGREGGNREDQRRR